MPEFLTFPIRGEKLSLTVSVNQHLAHRKSAFQTIDIYDTDVFGKVLLLDGHIQLAEFDEHAYHEALVQLPMLSLTTPRRALVVGGGDGGVIREICKHDSIQHVDMVEIDAGVIESCREHLPEVSAGAFDEPRVHIHIADAFGFLKEVSEPYDLIVMDITDVYEGEDGALSEKLFTDKFHNDCKDALTDSGILVTQADNLVFCPYSLAGVLETLEGLFPQVGAYQAVVPSFGGFSGFAWGSISVEINPTFPGSKVDLLYLNSLTWDLAFQPFSFSPIPLIDQGR